MASCAPAERPSSARRAVSASYSAPCWRIHESATGIDASKEIQRNNRCRPHPGAMVRRHAAKRVLSERRLHGSLESLDDEGQSGKGHQRDKRREDREPNGGTEHERATPTEA